MVRLWYVWDHWHFASIVRLAENLKRSWQEVHREATGFPRFLRFPREVSNACGAFVPLSFLFVRQLLGLHWRNKRTMRKLEKTFLHNLFLMTGTSTYVIERHMKSWNDMKTQFRSNFPDPSLPLILQESATDPASAGNILHRMSLTDLTNTLGFDAWKCSTGLQWSTALPLFNLQTFQRSGQKRKSLEEEDRSWDLSNRSAERMEEIWREEYYTRPW